MRRIFHIFDGHDFNACMHIAKRYGQKPRFYAARFGGNHIGVGAAPAAHHFKLIGNLLFDGHLPQTLADAVRQRRRNANHRAFQKFAAILRLRIGCFRKTDIDRNAQIRICMECRGFRAALDYRMEWEDAFLSYIKALDSRKAVIFCGDLNVAHNEIDLKNPKTNRMNAGFTDQEREKFSVLLSEGFADTFRTLHPDDILYSWWSYRFKAREKNTGWRIDYFVCSQRIMPLVESASIHTAIHGSDHCPVELVINL